MGRIFAAKLIKSEYSLLQGFFSQSRKDFKKYKKFFSRKRKSAKLLYACRREINKTSFNYPLDICRFIDLCVFRVFALLREKTFYHA
jgi:hypothetical protein